MPGVTPEMIEEARQMDLQTYLENYERHKLVPSGRSAFCTREHDSLKISNGKWMWFSRGFGGYSALDYLIEVEGIPFIEAVQMITGQAAIAPPVLNLDNKVSKKASKLLLPKKNINNDIAINYLIGRGINMTLIDELIERGLIFESTAPYHNVMFIGVDENGTPKHAAYRATNGERVLGDASGSIKAFSFNIVSRENKVLNLFEGTIDLLSYITLRIELGNDWHDENYLALAGIYAPRDPTKTMKMPVAIERILSITNTEIIKIHFDNDYSGKSAAAAVENLLKDKYKILDDPPPIGKDYNEFLQMAGGNLKGE